MSKLLIIPDVHGRSFWKEEVYRVIENEEDTHIVFLGDYIDPYTHEGIFPEDGIAALEEIIDLKKRCPKQITLLLGNHDCGYLWSGYVCSARRSNRYYNDIHQILAINLNLFDLAYSYKTKNKKYLFTHAGVHKYWFELLFGDKYDINHIEDYLNNWFHTADTVELEQYLGMYSYFRGYIDNNCGSCVWGDVREWSEEIGNVKDTNTWNIYQIFGHTQLEVEPIIRDTFACIDVRRYFYLTDEDKLLDIKHPMCEWEYDLKKEQ